jgi:NtrC-family two-component system response regulator AlgB
MQVLEEDFPNTIATKNFQMRDIIKTAKDIADSDIPVMIEGESGTGKELLARFIHENSQRKESPFMAINCAAIPENLFESELFGHTKGSFTGAIKDRIGRFELADQGTVFLDEVAEIPKPMQVKLLRFLQSMEYERVGESITRKINVRIISATNRDITAELNKGELRDDFYYRISGVRFKLPPLSQRKEDIPILADFFITKYSPGKTYEISPETMKFLMDYDWPGNVREFENIIKRLIVFSKDGLIKPEFLPVEILNEKPKQFSNILPKLEELEKQHIIEVLRLAPNPKEAAKILGISETTLWRKRKLYDL